MKLGKSDRVHEIRLSALERIALGDSNPSSLLQQQFDISRTSATSHLRWLTKHGFLRSTGNTRATNYTLASKRFFEKVYPLDGIQEHHIYNDFHFVFQNLGKNIVDACHYGLTEMVNNAIDHSNGEIVSVEAYSDHDTVTIEVFDNGVGIFQHIATELRLRDPREAILELHKGKLTTDPVNHTGEGIFFTSRAFDSFFIHSDDLTFSHGTKRSADILMDFGDAFEGTLVVMKTSSKSKRTIKEIFDEFTSGDDFSFDRTIIPVVQLVYNNEPLLSRSQAKRLLSRLDRFRHIVLDFKDVSFIGQGFADEIFRVFRRAHPEIQIDSTNANQDISKMIQRVSRG